MANAQVFVNIANTSYKFKFYSICVLLLFTSLRVNYLTYLQYLTKF